MNESGGIRYFSFEDFEDDGVTQAIFTRHGGVSLPPYATLNTGSTVGDDQKAVNENRRRCFQAVDRDLANMFDVWQVHSTRVIVADAPRPPDQPHERADIIMTGNPEVVLFMRFADCVPIFLVDPRQGCIAMVHAGWMGTLNRAASVAVQAMSDHFGSQPQDLMAGIGPSIGVDHYPVGKEVWQRVEKEYQAISREVLVRRNGKVNLDLWRLNRSILEEAGVRRIQTAGICTACAVEDWFSHRAEHGKTGRFGALLALKK